MKNLKINNKRIKALVGAIILSTNLTACRVAKPEETTEAKQTYTFEDSVLNSDGIQYLVIEDGENQKIVPVEDLKLVNSKNEVIEKIDGVIVNEKIMGVENPVNIMFSDNIDEVIIGYDILPVSEFSLINGKTGEKLTNIVGAYVNNEFVVVNNKQLDESILTTERFYALVDAKIAECKEKGIEFDESDIVSLALNVNLNKLLIDNPELVYTIIGGQSITEAEHVNLMLDCEKIQDTFNAYNLDLFRATGKTDGFILISDLIFDAEEKEKAEFIEKKVNEIGSYSRVDVAKMNEIITPFLTDLYNCKADVYNMEAGTRYGLRYILRPIRDLYGLNECEDQITLNKENLHLIKYFVSYVGDDNEYYINGWGTGAYQDVYGLLNDHCKTLTK